VADLLSASPSSSQIPKNKTSENPIEPNINETGRSVQTEETLFKYRETEEGNDLLNVTLSLYLYLKKREQDKVIGLTEEEFHLKSIVDDVIHRFCKAEPKKLEYSDPFATI